MKLIVEFGIEPDLLNKPHEFLDALMKTINTLVMVVPGCENMEEAYTEVLAKNNDEKRTLFELRHGQTVGDIKNPVAARLVLDSATFDREPAVISDEALVLVDDADIEQVHEALSRGDKDAVAHMRVGARKEEAKSEAAN